MKRPELFIPRQDQPTAGTHNHADNTEYSPSVQLYWSVPLLPERMGYLHTARKLEGESTGQYFLKVEATFYPDGVSLYGHEPLPDGSHPHADIPYEELAHIIEQADTSVRGRNDPPPAMTVYEDEEAGANSPLPARRHAGRLRVVEVPEPAFTFEVADDEVPF